MPKPIHTVAVCPNPAKDIGLSVTHDAIAVLAGCGAKPILPQSMREALGPKLPTAAVFVPDHALFDDDAIVLSGMAREVTLESPSGKRAVTVSFPDMPYLGIWHWPRTDAPYVCIEPWRSLPARKGKIAVFEQQEDLVALDAGKTYTNTWTISISD